MNKITRSSGVMNLKPRPIFRFVIGEKIFFLKEDVYYKLKEIFAMERLIKSQLADFTRDFYETVAFNPFFW